MKVGDIYMQNLPPTVFCILKIEEDFTTICVMYQGNKRFITAYKEPTKFIKSLTKSTYSLIGTAND